jgi:hypothetical protein
MNQKTLDGGIRMYKGDKWEKIMLQTFTSP